MSGAVFTPSATPRRLLGGSWRLAIERWRLGLVIARPVALTFAVVIVAGSFGAVTPAPGPFAVIALCGLIWVLRRRLRASIVRAGYTVEWRYAARSAGLVRIAELAAVDVEHDPGGRHVEVAPSLVRLDVLPAGRRYVLRPLPGQRLDDFDRASEPLALRWKAEAVTVARHPRRRGLLVVEVEKAGTLNDPVGWR